MFLGGSVLASLTEFFTGTLLEKTFHRKWWDYSNEKFNFDGYTCLKYSTLWGILAVLMIYFVNPFLQGLLMLIPHFLLVIGGWVLLALLALDTLGTALAIRGLQKKLQPVQILRKI